MCCPPITFNAQNWICTFPSLPSPLLLMMLSLLLSQPITHALWNLPSFHDAVDLQVLQVPLASPFSWGHQLFTATTELLLQFSSPSARTCSTSYLICQPQLFLLQSIRPDTSHLLFFMDSLIHLQELRNMTLGQALSCGYKAEYDPVPSLFIQCSQLLISSQPDPPTPTPTHPNFPTQPLSSVPSVLMTTSVASSCSSYPRHLLSLIHISHFYSSFKTRIKSRFLSECFSNHPASGPCLLSCGLAVSNVAVIFGTAT